MLRRVVLNSSNLPGLYPQEFHVRLFTDLTSKGLFLKADMATVGFLVCYNIHFPNLQVMPEECVRSPGAAVSAGTLGSLEGHQGLLTY
ncbi:hypothetical protein LEMLEM_LOCUS10187 [Lemmus lemmus]